MKKENIIQALKVITLGLILAVGLNYAFAWTAPTVNPPGGNVSAPINVSGVSQTKTGSLWSDSFIGSSGGGYFGGDLEVANGKGITLGGVKKTTWPSGGGSTDWNSITNKPAGFADGVDNEQVKGNSIYLCPAIGNCGGCTGGLKINAPTCRYSTRTSRDNCGENGWRTASCTFTGYLVQ